MLLPAHDTIFSCKSLLLALGLLALAGPVFSQKPTPADARLSGFEQHKNLKQNTLLGSLKAESIGPSVFSCRVTDVEVNPTDPTEMYVAYASSGLPSRAQQIIASRRPRLCTDQ